MYFAKSLIVCASLIASTMAQSSRIAFTVLPSSITAGQDVTLHWAGGDGSPVTLTLQQGTTDDLKTVQLVKGDATGTEYTWPVPKSLPNGDNYAFKIGQGDEPPNYTGMIALTGGSASSASASSAAASSSASTPVSGSPSSSANSTAKATGTSNSTTTAPVGTAASASGTGTSIARNTTLSSATLSATASTSSNSNIGGSGGSPTASTTAPASTSSKASGAAMLASNFALLVCAVVGVVYLG